MKYLDDLMSRKKNLVHLKNDIELATKYIIDCYKKNNKVLVCGNGGSSSDSNHIMAELMKGFKKERKINENLLSNIYKEIEEFSKKINCVDFVEKYNLFKDNLQQGLPCIDLTIFSALNSAFANDKDSFLIYANSVISFGKEGDILISITTSGNSKNVVYASIVAKAMGMKVISLTGNNGGVIKNISDICICVDESETYKIQEEHISIYHTICLDVEDILFE